MIKTDIINEDVRKVHCYLCAKESPEATMIGAHEGRFTIVLFPITTVDSEGLN